MVTNFPLGSRFYLWNKLPMVTVPGPQGRKFYDCSDHPFEILYGEALHSAREIDFAEFKRLRAAAIKSRLSQRRGPLHQLPTTRRRLGGDRPDPAASTALFRQLCRAQLRA